MNKVPESMPAPLQQKAQELGLWEDAFFCALDILGRNKELVNAMDYKSEMDEYIYRAIIRNSMDRRKRDAEWKLENGNEGEQRAAEKDLSMLSKEELITDPYYRAILPIISKILQNEPILRLHADEASDVIVKLADVKRKHRATSLTEVIVTRCRKEIESYEPGSALPAGTSHR